MKTRSRGAGGFALVTVVVMIAFAGVAAMAISAGFAAESRRVRTCGADAQLRQLLLAGAVRASEDFNNHSALETLAPESSIQTVKLPNDLAPNAASIQIVEEPDPADANRRFADITTTFGSSRARQRVMFKLVEIKWVMTDARLQ